MEFLPLRRLLSETFLYESAWRSRKPDGFLSPRVAHSEECYRLGKGRLPCSPAKGGAIRCTQDAFRLRNQPLYEGGDSVTRDFLFLRMPELWVSAFSILPATGIR